VPPAALRDRYEVEFFGDDIAWMYVDPADGRIYAMNPEFGVFGVAKDTNESSNPNAIDAIAAGTKTLFTNVAYHPGRGEVWWEGRTPDYPTDVSDWLDWKGIPITDRPAGKQRSTAAGDEWSHPNSRFTTTLANVPNASPDTANPRGVPIDAIIFGGRVRDREPLVRAITDLAEGVYDGLTLGAEATAAADGKAGVLRYDPMSMRPFLSYAEGHYAEYRIAEDVKGCGQMPQERVAQHLTALTAAFDAAKAVIRTPSPVVADISDSARPVAIDGSWELLERGDQREAIFWMVATWLRCQMVLAHDAPTAMQERYTPGYRRLLRDLGITTFGDLQRRSDQVKELLPQIWSVAEAIMAANQEIEA